MFEDLIKNIKPLSREAVEFSKKRWDLIAKPIKGLGKLEDAVSRLNGIYKTTGRIELKPALVVMCGDHGVVAEGVTQTDSSVTKNVMYNFEKKERTAAIMASLCGIDVFVADMGVNCERSENKILIPFKVCDRKIDMGTKNLLKTDAMTKEQFEAAVRTGVNVVKDLKNQGYNFILTGEMGIGNTTPSTVITCALLNKNPDDVTGRGAGLSKSGFERKKLVIKSALKRIGPMIDKSDVVGICSSCGGFEIAAMTGLFIGGALYGVPVMCDGFISLAAALSAVKIAPECKGYIFGSHLSAEPAVECLTNALDIDVYVNCGMHLGEGTGAVSAFPLFKMACGVYNDMVTFNDIKIEAYKNFAEEEL